MLVATGAGTAAWGTDATGLTSLGVDNITIDGATVTSDTGTISFNDDHLVTGGSIYNGTETFKFHTNCFPLVDGTYSITGTLKIALPSSGWPNSHLGFKILGYQYGSGVWEVTIGGFARSSISDWQGYYAFVHGKPPFTSVRVGFDGTHPCILLGTTSTVWEIPVASISVMAFGVPDTFASGWSYAILTDESGISGIHAVPLSGAPSPTAANQVLVATAAGYTGWTTTLSG